LTESKNFAERLKREAGSDPAAQVKLGWRVALGREPDAAEIASAERYRADQRDAFAPLAEAERDPAKKIDPDFWALTVLGQALLSSNEFLYVD
ncbi:MAG TPA: hypothetical protein PLV92_16845, partial [Pirellulaceae bacterium]|nr:hypothetical protein [Pirellulaceae bacterium]